MRKVLLLLTVVGLLVTGCGSTPTLIPTSPPLVATSTIPTPTFTLTFTETPIPSATATPELPISADASTYLEEALDIMQNNSLHRDSIDWEALRESAFKIAEHAQTPADTYGAIRYALSELGDHHSHFLTAEENTQRQQLTMNDIPQPRAKLLLGKLGFVAIEEFAGREGDEYATAVQQLIRDIDTHQPCGWIVDLRENEGGGIGPMLAGLGPILGEGQVGASVDVNGSKQIWSYQDGRALAAGQVFAQVHGPAYELKTASPPVAVLTGMKTASAGEAIVVAFRGRPNTRSFGLYTAGVPTGNAGFILSDGAMIALTVAVFADRTGQTYDDRIYPDEWVDEVQKLTIIMDEIIPQPAIDWLLSQPACTVMQ
jgi:carboxyl-terminal processing protease